MDVLPLPSSKVQVTTEVPCVVRVNASVVVPVIVPEQLSVAVGALPIVAEHSPVASAKEAASGTDIRQVGRKPALGCLLLFVRMGDFQLAPPHNARISALVLS